VDGANVERGVCVDYVSRKNLEFGDRDATAVETSMWLHSLTKPEHIHSITMKATYAFIETHQAYCMDSSLALYAALYYRLARHSPFPDALVIRL
jgi:hypothetical protein